LKFQLDSTKDIRMAKSKPTDVIDAYRRLQERKSFFTFGDISKALLLLIMLAALLYALFTGGPDLPVLIELKTNTPTLTPSITPTPTNTATITPTPTETPDPDMQCDCPSPEIVVVTATFSASNTPVSLPSASNTASPASTGTSTLTPTNTLLPTETPTPSPSATFTPTQIVYTVQAGDTLSDIALRFGVTVEAIQALNNLDTQLIIQGQTLLIPRP
jgi:LysM repeat protein